MKNRKLPGVLGGIILLIGLAGCYPGRSARHETNLTPALEDSAAAAAAKPNQSQAGEASAAQSQAPAAPEQPSDATKSPQQKSLAGVVEFGKANYYSDNMAGKKTATGEPYDPKKLTAAHPSLPLGTICLVTNMANGKSVEVRINDRNAGKKGIILDLSREAAAQLDALKAGTIEVKLEVLE